MESLCAHHVSRAPQTIVLLVLPQTCFPHGTPSLLSAKSSTHLPTLDTLELSPSLLDAVIPLVQPPTIMSPAWDLPSFIPITPAHAFISSSWSLQLACLPIPVPSFSLFLPKVAEVIYIKHTWAYLSTSYKLSMAPYDP